MSLSLHVCDARGTLSPFAPAIRDAAEDAWRRASAALPLGPVDLVVRHVPGWAIPERGHVGYTPTASLIELTADPALPAFRDHLGESLSRALAHEFHHAARWDGPGYGTTLGEGLVSEGLACIFAREIYPGPPEPWEAPAPGTDMDALLGRAVAEWDAPFRLGSRWIGGGDGLPRWAIYAAGTRIAADALARTGHMAADAVHMAAAEFRPA